MTNDERQRMANMINYVNELVAIDKKNCDVEIFNKDPENIRRSAEIISKNVPNNVVTQLLSKVFKSSMPEIKGYETSIKNADIIMGSAIDKFTTEKDNYNLLKTVTEKKPSPLLERVMQIAMDEKYNFVEKSKEVIDVKALDYNPKMDDDNLSDMYSDLSFDEISDRINDNVKKTIQAEKEKAVREEEEKNRIEEILINDDEVYDDATMESSLKEMNKYTLESNYQPSLFEGIMSSKLKTCSDIETSFREAVEDYTALSICKMLRLYEFSSENIKRIAKCYE